jgi:hypothetical protein
MNTFELVTLIIAALSGLGGLIISIYNFRLSKSNRRNFMRQKVYEHQFNFFMGLNEHMAIIEDELGHINQDWINTKEAKQNLFNANSRLDMFVRKNELIIPNQVLGPLEDYTAFLQKNVTAIIVDTSNVSEEFWNELYSRYFNLQTEINENLNLDQLSRENKTLARKKRFEAK